MRHFSDPELSIYVVPSAADLSRLIAAFALAHPKQLQSSDLIYVDDTLVDLSNVYVVTTEGLVPDPVVRQWHREWLQLDDHGRRAIAFAFGCHGTCRRVPLAEVRRCVIAAHDGNFYEPNRLSPGVAADLAKVLRSRP